MNSKLIAKGVAIGLILNNLITPLIVRSTDVEIHNRYQTLEGEYITIDDSTQGELHEIEIFGNTIQDENNLEDIQSVGDLYVDETGNPILDSQGREQYKIEIVTNNGNLFDEQWIKHPTITYTEKIQSKNYIPVNDKLTYITNDMDAWYSELGYRSLIAQCYDKNFTHLGHVLIYANTYMSFNLIDGTKYIKFDLDGTIDNLDKIYCQLNIGNTLDVYKPQEKHKTTILLPQQLRKVTSSNTANPSYEDKLYWDEQNSRYIIEQNVSYRALSNTFSLAIENYNGSVMSASNGETVREISSNIQDDETYYDMFTQRGVIVEGFKNLAYSYYRPSESMMWDGFYGSNSMRLYFSEEYDTKNKMKEYIKDKYVYIPLKNPVFVPTNITSKLKIPTYDGETYIYVETENGINPTLKITVDRISQVAKDAIEEAKINPTTENISLARIYINMLPESTYKDQLQEQLNEVFSSDVTLDKKTATANLDIYIKSENMLSLSLDTNSVAFEEYSGAEPMEKLGAVNITINSSLPYDLNAYMPTEISNADGSNKMGLDLFNIKESSEDTYQQFENNTEKIVLKQGCVSGNDIKHSIDLKLDSNDAYVADIYKTVIKFEAEQK